MKISLQYIFQVAHLKYLQFAILSIPSTAHYIQNVLDSGIHSFINNQFTVI